MKKQNTKLPKWFKGQLYDEGDTVKNPFSGEECELNNVELSMYDFTRLNNNNMTTETTQVTQDEFDSYVEVQESGITNMFNVNVVSDYSGLSRDKIMTIMKNYGDLNDRYGH